MKRENDIEMNLCVASLSSNIEADKNMAEAKVILKNYFSNIRFSSQIQTLPQGKGYTSDFLNSVVMFSTDLTFEYLNEILKTIETQLGRTSLLKMQKKVPIDIDIICWNGQVVHSDYKRFPFLRKLIGELDVDCVELD